MGDNRLDSIKEINKTITENYEFIYADPETIENIIILIPK